MMVAAHRLEARLCAHAPVAVPIGEDCSAWSACQGHLTGSNPARRMGIHVGIHVLQEQQRWWCEGRLVLRSWRKPESCTMALSRFNRRQESRLPGYTDLKALHAATIIAFCVA